MKEDLFEEGRQDVINELTDIILRRLKFNKSCIEDEHGKYTYTKEQMQAFDQIYLQVLSTLLILKTKKEDSKRFGTTQN